MPACDLRPLTEPAKTMSWSAPLGSPAPRAEHDINFVLSQTGVGQQLRRAPSRGAGRGAANQLPMNTLIWKAFPGQGDKAGSVLGSWLQPGKLGADNTGPRVWSAGTRQEPGARQVAGETGRTEPLLPLVRWEEVNEPQPGFPPPAALAQVQFSAPD